MTARLCMPRRGLADPGWRYVPAAETDIEKTIKAELARLAADGVTDAHAERQAVRECIATLHALTDEEVLDLAADDVPLPMPPAPGPGRLVVHEWKHVGAGVWTPHRSTLQRGHLDPDAAVALAALALLAAAARFGGLF